MNVIIEFFTTLGNAIVGVIEFVINMVRDLVYMVRLFMEMLPAMPAFWTWLPAGLVYLLGLTFSIVVIFRILGRGD